MTIRTPRFALLTAALVAGLSLTACTAHDVIDTTVDVAAGTTKLAAKGVWEGGKLVYKGGAAAVGAFN